MEIIYGNSGIKKYISVCLGRKEYPGREDGNYVFGMLLENDIPYLVRPVMTSVDGMMTLEYDTENDYVLGNLLCGRKPDGALLNMFLGQINECLRELDAYLLDSDDLVLDPGFMLYKYDEKRLRLLYVPGYGRNIRSQLQSFLEFIMIHFDSRDTEGVRFLYGNYEMLKGNTTVIPGLPNLPHSSAVPAVQREEPSTDEMYQMPLTKESNDLPSYKPITLMPLKNGALKKLTVTEEDKPFVVGRHKRDTDYSIRTLQISRKHAVLLMHKGKLTVMDCASGNGTFVNSKRLLGDEPVELEPGDVVSFAGEEFYVE